MIEPIVTLASVLFTDYRRRVLGLLLLHPESLAAEAVKQAEALLARVTAWIRTHKPHLLT